MSLRTIQLFLTTLSVFLAVKAIIGNIEGAEPILVHVTEVECILVMILRRLYDVGEGQK